VELLGDDGSASGSAQESGGPLDTRLEEDTVIAKPSEMREATWRGRREKRPTRPST